MRKWGEERGVRRGERGEGREERGERRGKLDGGERSQKEERRAYQLL